MVSTTWWHTLFTSFDPQLKVVPMEGKTAPADDPILTQIRYAATGRCGY